MELFINQSKNPNAIPLLELDKIDLHALSRNPSANVIDIIQQNMDRLPNGCWHNLCRHPNAMPLLEQNQDKIN